MLGDECFVGEHAVINPGVKVYPFKTVEAGRGRQLVDRVGVAGAPARCSAATACAGSPTSTSPPSSRSRLAHGLRHVAARRARPSCTSRDTSRVARVLKRAMMAGLNLVGRQRRWTSRSPPCRSPGSRCAARSAQGGITVRLAPDDPAVGRDPLLRRRRRRHRPRRRSARSSGCSTARTSAGRSPATSATSASRPGPRVLHGRARASTVDVDGDPRPPASRSCSTTRYGAAVVRHAERAGQARAPTCWRSTRTPRPPGVVDVRPRRARRPAWPSLVRASGAHLGAVLDPDGEHLTLIDDDGPRAHRRRGAAGAARRSSREPTCSATASRCRCRSASAAERAGADARRRRSRGRSCRPPHLMEAAAEPGVGFAASQDGGFILPGFLPAFDAAATLVKLLDLLGPRPGAAVDGGRRAARASTSPTRRW